jgi:hypothetical protein
MNEKAQSEEFEDDDDVVDDEATLVGGEDVDVDRLFRDFDKRKRAGIKPGDPAWRRLEKFREEKHTAELVSDFDDYDIGSDLEDDGSDRPTPGSARHRAHG